MIQEEASQAGRPPAPATPIGGWAAGQFFIALAGLIVVVALLWVGFVYLSGSKTAMTEDEMKTAIQALANEVRSAQEAKAKEAGAGNRKEGDAFLAANKAKEGVKTTADGLQYKVLTEGNGPKPTANDTVTVNYRGTLINGKEFDSSYKR